MTPEEFLESNPSASRREIMKACGCSARVARRAETRALDSQQGPAWSRLSVLGLALGAGLLLAWGLAPGEVTGNGSKSPSDSSARTQVAAIYSALDQGDRSAVPGAVDQLSSEDPNLRLAALRLIAELDPSPYAADLLPLVDDVDPRVRISAIQLARRLQPEDKALRNEVAERLVSIAANPERRLGERVLALESLRDQSLTNAAGLLALLDDPRLASRTDKLLAKQSGHSATPTRGESLRQAWTRELGAGA